MKRYSLKFSHVIELLKPLYKQGTYTSDIVNRAKHLEKEHFCKTEPEESVVSQSEESKAYEQAENSIITNTTIAESNEQIQIEKSVLEGKKNTPKYKSHNIFKKLFKSKNKKPKQS